MKKISTVLAPLFFVFLVSCGKKFPDDKTPQDAIFRRAMCTAASQRLFLFEDAKNFFDQGIQIEREYRARTHNSLHFVKQVRYAEQIVIEMSIEKVAATMDVVCKRPITNAEAIRAGIKVNLSR